MTLINSQTKIPSAINEISLINENYKNNTGTYPKAIICTFGCQMNARDSETIDGMLKEMNYEKTLSENDADLIIYNTCCVRENAENRVFGKLGYLKNLKKKKNNLKIALCGCMMQQEHIVEKLKTSYKHVDVIFGTFNLHNFPELLLASNSGDQILDIWKDHDEIIEDLPAIRKYPFKASVNIMFGCNNFCSYCIVPYVRGRERSRDPENILKEIEDLAKDGVKEITLLGQNVNSYGKTLETPISFASLLERIQDISGIERIRFMTSHPKDLSDELIEVIAKNNKICNHIHLPIQSGSTSVLAEMNRGYTKEGYLELIKRIKSKISNIAITTDIIVGYPGETEEDFSDTLDVVKKVCFDGAFTFIYSPRSGTPAAQKKEIPEEIIKERFNRLTTEINDILLASNQSRIGRIYKVFVEEESGKESDILTGRTEENYIVHFKGSLDLIGTIVNVEITDCKSFYLEGVQYVNI